MSETTLFIVLVVIYCAIAIPIVLADARVQNRIREQRRESAKLMQKVRSWRA